MACSTPRLPAWLATGVLVSMATLASSAGAAPSITEYSSGLLSNAAPYGIATSLDGSMWFTESGPQKAIGTITPSGTITTPVAVDSWPSPLQITQGPEGNLWFTETGGAGNIGVVNSETHQVSEISLPGGSTPLGIVAGPEGDIWFTEVGGNAAIGRINPTTHELHEFKVPTANGQPAEIAVGPEEDLWFTEYNNPGAIGRLDPASGEITEYTSGLTKDSRPWGITAGPEGNMWFTETSPAKIGRISPATGAITEFSDGLTGGAPRDIVTGSDGNLYFTESSGGGALGQITPEGGITEYKEGLTSGASPWGIASGPDGNIWFVESDNPARIGRLTVAPSVTDEASVRVTSSTAEVTGELGANAQATSYLVEYGSTASYGARTAPASAGSGEGRVPISVALTGLTPGQTYHYRVVATNSAGTSAGSDAMFTTASATVAPEQTSPSLISGVPQPLSSTIAPPFQPSPLLSAVMGRSAGVETVSGSVYLRSPSGALMPLGPASTIPVGSVIDATSGVLRLVTALNTPGKTQAAIVWGGVFQVGQQKSGNGLTNLILAKTSSACTRHGGAMIATARAHHSKSNSLWAEDNHGRYSTHGANSVATVLGTRWETVETCAGTLTRVLRGRVRVRDLHQRRTVIVRAGHSYLARP